MSAIRGEPKPFNNFLGFERGFRQHQMNFSDVQKTVPMGRHDHIIVRSPFAATKQHCVRLLIFRLRVNKTQPDQAYFFDPVPDRVAA